MVVPPLNVEDLYGKSWSPILAINWFWRKFKQKSELGTLSKSNFQSFNDDRTQIVTTIRNVSALEKKVEKF